MERDSAPYFSKSRNVKELTPLDFSEVKVSHLKSKECSVVLFYVNWCGYCKKVKPDWERLGGAALFTNVLAFNCEKYSGHLSKIKEELPELVKGFPTIIFYRGGKPILHQPEELRDFDNLLKACMKFCKDSGKSKK